MTGTIKRRMSAHSYAHPEKTLKPLRKTADRVGVQAHIRVLKQLVDDSLYVVDERAVAAAILARAAVRESVAAPEFRAEQGSRPVRSFRRARGAPSFRLTHGAMAEHHR